MQKDENGKVHRQDFLTVKPEIRRIDINYEVDDFILLGSDGIFDKITSQECCNFIR
jgi:serine/threonine protein phosphatase PrpC